MKKNQVSVSVIVPVYNCREWLEICVESVLKQTFKDYELILVDDGSNDGSSEICDHYANMYACVKVVHKVNGYGAGEARNVGIEQSCGEFIIFLDADDYQEPDMLEKMLSAQKDGDYDLVVCGYRFIAEDQKPGPEFLLDKKEIYTKSEAIDYFVSYYPHGLLGYPWNKLYRRSIIEENRIKFPKMRRLEDGIFNVEYIQHVEKMKILALVLMNYRVNSQVVLRKLPYDFYDNMKVFTYNYYDFLKKAQRNIKVSEAPFVYYFLNDFVCCLENILGHSWEGKSFRNKKQDIMNLRNDEMVCYMIKKVACVPRYSRLIIKLFEKRYIGILWWVIRLKLWMKTNLKTFFGIMKKKLN